MNEADLTHYLEGRLAPQLKDKGLSPAQRVVLPILAPRALGVYLGEGEEYKAGRLPTQPPNKPPN
jgi:hypothetical protein